MQQPMDDEVESGMNKREAVSALADGQLRGDDFAQAVRWALDDPRAARPGATTMWWAICCARPISPRA